VALALLVSVSAMAQRIELLWPDGARSGRTETRQAVHYHLSAAAEKASGAVVICPVEDTESGMEKEAVTLPSG